MLGLRKDFFIQSQQGVLYCEGLRIFLYNLLLNSSMKKSRKIQTWYDVYLCLHENGRAHIGDICKKINYTGRGKNRDTISQYLNEAFEKSIITRPRLTLANHEGDTLYAHLLSGVDNRIELFEKLRKHPRVLYVSLLNGDYQLFFTSHARHVSLPYQCETSPIFTPLYTVPGGWNHSEHKCLKMIISHLYEENKLPRPVCSPLDWEPLDWEIYNVLRMNVRESLKKAAQTLNTTYETIRLHLQTRVLPQTIQFVGFFPQGLQNYSHLIFLVKTPCEQSFVSALSKLQTSCLIWPLQTSLMCFVYFQNLNIFLKTIFILEKKKIFKEYYFLFPLKYSESGVITQGREIPRRPQHHME